MNLSALAIVTGGLLLYALVSGRLNGTVITAPLVFIVFGYVAGPGGLGVAQVDVDHSIVHAIAEFTLIVVLFADAARMDLKRLRADHNLPVRMLVVGLPLCIAAGTLAATQLFPAFTLWEAALLAALLAPTDAALGQAVVADKTVPVRIRQAINVESGLNDGIALPAVLLFATLASMHMSGPDAGEWLRFGLAQLALGPLVGVVLGYAGGRCLDAAASRGWADTSFQGIGILALAILTFVVAELVGGNGFIAAFVGGLAFGGAIRSHCEFLFEFMEAEGQLLMLIAFLVFGATLLPEGVAHLGPAVIVYALLSLTVLRMIPIALSLAGAGLNSATPLFLGWFGPRGLASILFVLLILEESDVPHRETILSVTVVTVGLSALLHGMTAAPLAGAYGRLARRMGDCEEMQPVTPMPLREGYNSDTSKDATGDVGNNAGNEKRTETP